MCRWFNSPGIEKLRLLWSRRANPSPGYTVSGVTADPKLVTLQGDPATITSLSGYITVPVDITGANQDVVDRVPLQLQESVSPLGVQSIEVRVAIVPITGVQSVQRSPTVQGLAPGLTYTLTLDTANLFLSGPVPKLDALRPEDAPVIVDLTGLGPGVHVVVPTVPSPEGVVVEGISPETIEVTIGLLPTPEPSLTLTPGPTPTRRN